MKTFKYLFTAIIILICCQNSFSQLDWRLLVNSPGTTGVSRFEDIHFINENTGWCVGYTGRVYKTTNAGSNWVSTHLNTTSNELRSVGFFDENVGLYGTLFTDTNLILYRTTNGGSNWSSVSSITGKRPQGICGIGIATENIAYACGRYYGSARVIKTTDKGATWNVVFNDTSMARTLIDCYFWSADSGIVVGGYNTTNYAQGNAVILKTTNGGATWTRTIRTTRTGEWCWKISFVNRNTGYVSIERFEGFAYILKTTDNGNNWSEIPFMTYDVEGIGFVNENTGWIGGWTGPTYKTTNGGLNWSLANWGYNLNRFRFINDTVAYAVGDRIFKYSRGPVGITNLSTEIPDRFELLQNYPNPFNPVTKIKFNINADIPLNKVTLIIYDITGKVVQTLVDQSLSPGTYEAEFDASDKPSGAYYYKLTAGSLSETKMMVVIK